MFLLESIIDGAEMPDWFPAPGRASVLGFVRLIAGAGMVLAAACAPATASTHRHHYRPSHLHSTHMARGARVAHNWRWQPTRNLAQLTEPQKDAALILDGETGRTLYARNPDALRHPASLTKMMTLYLLFEQLKNGQMTLATPIQVSWHASSQAPTKLYARPGTTIPVEDAVKAVVVLSANDVAVAISEAIGGSESHFAEMMTAKARSWGMTHTFFHNASGLPDELQVTSAGDLGILARHLAYDFPQYFHYFSTYSFTWRGATHYTHDNLIGRYDGADGIKTGYTGASGFNLVSSVVRNGVHIIGVVMGGTTARRRDTEMVRLLDDTFAAIGRNPLLVARATVPWQMIAQTAQTRPLIAGFQFGASNSSPPSVSVLPAPAMHPAGVAARGIEDEEAAESSPDPAYEPAAVTAKPAMPLAPASKTMTLSPPVVSKPATVSSPPANGKTILASLEPSATRAVPAAAPASPPGDGAPRPQPKPSMPPLTSAASHPAPADVAPAGARANWTVQIGAFGDANLAQSELATYAHQSADVLGDAARIVSPLASAEGHVLYRARFGPFDEGHARQVCQVLAQRGQTCFASR